MKKSGIFLTTILLIAGCKTRVDDSMVKGLEQECAGQQAGPQVVTKTNAPVVKPFLPNGTGKPVLIYYAVDSAEPFMRLAVDHELHALKKSCEKYPEASWVAFLNSHFVHGNKKFLICKNGSWSSRSLPVSLESEIGRIRDDLKTYDNPSIPNVSFPLGFTAGQNHGPVYSNFPLAHPDVLYKLLTFTRDELFPANEYMQFLHLKSHGSTSLVMTGLTEDQTKSKTDCQNTILKNKAGPQIVQKLGEVGLGEVGLGQIGLGEVGLGEVGLGEVGLGEVGLGEVGLGVAGLGTNGLGVNNHFGIEPGVLYSALNRYFLDSVDLQIGFMLMESCDSDVLNSANTTQFFLGSILNRLRAHYSANGSLWYRNIDYGTFFKEWKAGGANNQAMQKRFVDWTGKMTVFVANGTSP